MGSLRLQDGVGESHAKGGVRLAGTSHYLHWPEEGAEEAIRCFGIIFSCIEWPMGLFAWHMSVVSALVSACGLPGVVIDCLVIFSQQSLKTSLVSSSIV